MEELEQDAQNLSHDDVIERIQEFPLRPPRNKIIMTINVDQVEEGDLEDSVNTLSETQYIMAVGSHVKEFKPGQKVLIDLRQMMVSSPSRHNAMEENGQVQIDPVEVDGKLYTFTNERVIKAEDLR